MEDKLILEVHKSAVITSNIVRLSDEAILQIKQIQAATGFPASQLVSKMVMYAAERIEIKEI